MSLLRPISLLLAGACSALLTLPAAAQSASLPPNDDAARLRTAEKSAAAGVFLTYTESATTETHNVAASSQVGYDGNREGAFVHTRAEGVILAGPSGRGGRARSPVGLSVVGGGSYIDATAQFPSSSSGFGGLKLQPIFQERFGFDAAVMVTYQSRGFNLTPAVAADVLLGRRIGDTQLLLNIGYGQGVTEGERYGRVRAASLTRVVDELRVGIDGRFMADLELEWEEPTGEPEFEANVGPVVSYTISHISLSATVGPAALRYRDGRDTLLGVAANFGIGGTL